jgi:peptidoglycan L-alanyl-D-glutamate endopeptidase CwlK
MPKFSQKSRSQLDTCCDEIRIVLCEAIREIDFSVICGYRSNHVQQELYEQNLSKSPAGYSKLNRIPSDAVDIAPWPIDWEDTDRFIYFAGHIMRIAMSRCILVRWGGDWNMDTKLNKRFKDLAHFEVLRRH